MTNAIAMITNDGVAHSVLIIDGQTLSIVQASSVLQALFTNIAVAAESVICCRASPTQKAYLVKTVQTQVKGSVTLAISDGANDIAMIQEAHVGIGTAGKEGLQAARTSDYSVAQFRFLLKLLLVHGRWNYARISKYVLGTFWKEMFLYLVQAMYQRWTVTQVLRCTSHGVYRCSTHSSQVCQSYSWVRKRLGCFDASSSPRIIQVWTRTQRLQLHALRMVGVHGCCGSSHGLSHHVRYLR